jgi:hypothetical protein
MIRLLAVLVLVACGHTAPVPHPEPVTVQQRAAAPDAAPATDAAAATDAMVAADALAPDAQPQAPAQTLGSSSKQPHPTRVTLRPATLAVNTVCPKTTAGPTGPCHPKGPVIGTQSGSVCEYPEGHCNCVDETPPHGAMIPEYARTYMWRCRPWDPKVWPDGCPSGEISVGGTCTGSGVCAYGDQYDSIAYTCKSGHWDEGQRAHHPRPPPPPPPP